MALNPALHLSGTCAPTTTVRIPTPLRSLTGGASEVEALGRTVREVLVNMCALHPGLAPRLFDQHGELRPFVNVFVGARDVRTLDGLASAVEAGAVISILPAVAGGAR